MHRRRFVGEFGATGQKQREDEDAINDKARVRACVAVKCRFNGQVGAATAESALRSSSLSLHAGTRARARGHLMPTTCNFLPVPTLERRPPGPA